MLAVVGLVVAVIGVFLWKAKDRALEKVAQLKGAETKKVGDLQEIAQEIGGEIGGGSFREVVEVRGDARCDSPLASELSNTPCLYYRFEVKQEYEEEYEEYNQQTQRHERRTRRSSRTVASNSRSCPFFLRDDTGEIEVLPDGAEIDTERTLSAFEPEQRLFAGSGTSLTYGGVTLSLGSSARSLPGSRSRVLGYRLEEHVLPMNRRLYILGEVNDGEGRLQLRKPEDKAKVFIISTKPKDAIIASAQSSAKMLWGGAIGCYVIGAALVIGGIVQLITG
jgi:hypothetical protein